VTKAVGKQNTENQSLPKALTGILGLDEITGGGLPRGRPTLVCSSAGCGKTLLAIEFLVRGATQHGEPGVFMAFEETADELDLEPWVKTGLLRFHAVRSSLCGLEMHLASIQKLVQEFQPQVVIFDPIGTLIQAGSRQDATAMLTRLIDYFKSQRITAFLTNLTSADEALEQTDVDISSLVDTWLLLRDLELGGERNRALYILKSRGMAHSNQIREFLLTDRGIELADVYLGPEGVLTGSARQSQEAREKSAALLRQQEVEGKQREMERKREALEARIAAMRKEFEAEEEEVKRVINQDNTRDDVLRQDRQRMRTSRQADNGPERVEAPVRPRKTSGGRR
jgi:circadian clock protein KaiC